MASETSSAVDQVRGMLESYEDGLYLLDLLPECCTMEWTTIGRSSCKALSIGTLTDHNTLCVAFLGTTGKNPNTVRFAIIYDRRNPLLYSNLQYNQIEGFLLHPPFKHLRGPTKHDKRLLATTIKWYFMSHGILNEAKVETEPDVSVFSHYLHHALCVNRMYMVKAGLAEHPEVQRLRPRQLNTTRTYNTQTTTPQTATISARRIARRSVAFQLPDTQAQTSHEHTRVYEITEGVMPTENRLVRSADVRAVMLHLKSRRSQSRRLLEIVPALHEMEFCTQSFNPDTSKMCLFLGQHGDEFLFACLRLKNKVPGISYFVRNNKQDSSKGKFVRSHYVLTKPTIMHPFNKCRPVHMKSEDRASQKRLKFVVAWYFLCCGIPRNEIIGKCPFKTLIMSTFTYIAKRMSSTVTGYKPRAQSFTDEVSMRRAKARFLSRTRRGLGEGDKPTSDPALMVDVSAPESSNVQLNQDLALQRSAGSASLFLEDIAPNIKVREPSDDAWPVQTTSSASEHVPEVEAVPESAATNTSQSPYSSTNISRRRISNSLPEQPTNDPGLPAIMLSNQHTSHSREPGSAPQDPTPRSEYGNALIHVSGLPSATEQTNSFHPMDTFRINQSSQSPSTTSNFSPRGTKRPLPSCSTHTPTRPPPATRPSNEPIASKSSNQRPQSSTYSLFQRLSDLEVQRTTEMKRLSAQLQDRMEELRGWFESEMQGVEQRFKLGWEGVLEGIEREAGMDPETDEVDVSVLESGDVDLGIGTEVEEITEEHVEAEAEAEAGAEGNPEGIVTKFEEERQEIKVEIEDVPAMNMRSRNRARAGQTSALVASVIEIDDGPQPHENRRKHNNRRAKTKLDAEADSKDDGYYGGYYDAQASDGDYNYDNDHDDDHDYHPF